MQSNPNNMENIWNEPPYEDKIMNFYQDPNLNDPNPKSYSKGCIITIILIIVSPAFLWWLAYDQINSLKIDSSEVLEFRVGLPAEVINIQSLNSNNLMAVIKANNKLAEKLNPIITKTPWGMSINEISISNKTRKHLKDTLMWLVTFRAPKYLVFVNYRKLLQSRGWYLEKEDDNFLLARNDNNEVVTISYILGGEQTQYSVIIRKDN